MTADEYNNTYHLSIGKKDITVDYSDLIEETETSHKSPKFKVGDRIIITTYKNSFSKGYIDNWPREIFPIDFVLKNNL